MLPLLFDIAFAPPLIPAADIADSALQIWWRDGDLLAGLPDKPGRPGVRPLIDPAPLALPADLSDWTLLGEPCANAPSPAVRIGDLEVTASVAGVQDTPLVQLKSGARVISAYPLGRPAMVCGVLVAQADNLPGLELIVVWRSLEEGDALRGLRVFHIPEGLR